MTSRAIATAAAAMRAGRFASLLATARTEPNPHFAELLKGPDMRAWELQAKGYIHAAEEEAVQLEAELADRLRAVLSEPKFAAFFSVLGTPSYHGEVHTPQGTPTPAAPAPAAVESDQAPAAQPQIDPEAIEKAMESFGLTREQLASVVQLGQKLGVVPVPTEQPVQQ